MIVFTKCDKMCGEDFKKGVETAEIIRDKYDNSNFYIHFTSSLSLLGIEELRSHLMFEIVACNN